MLNNKYYLHILKGIIMFVKKKKYEKEELCKG